MLSFFSFVLNHILFSWHIVSQSTEQNAQSQAELEESNQKEGVEIEEARSTIADVERFFQSTEA